MPRRIRGTAPVAEGFARCSRRPAGLTLSEQRRCPIGEDTIVEIIMSSSLIARLATPGLVGVAVAGMFAGLASPAAAATPDGPLAPAPMAVISALPYGPDTCAQGFVWREASPADHVCVTPQTRQATRDENALAASRREPNGGAYGPNTCKQGYVWREAYASDLV